MERCVCGGGGGVGGGGGGGEGGRCQYIGVIALSSGIVYTHSIMYSEAYVSVKASSVL